MLVREHALTPMHSFPARLLTGLVVALLALVVSATEAHAWGEVERRDLPALLGPPSELPPFPAEVTRKPSPRRPSVAEQLPTKQRPLAVEVDVDGTMYVVAQGRGFEVEGSAIGVTGWPYIGYLYSASLITVYRVSANLDAVEEIRTFLAQTETGFPDKDGINEALDAPAGLALDRDLRKLYLSVPGSGIWAMGLDTDAWGAGPLIPDDHEIWLPYENETDFDEGGEGLTSPAVTARDADGVPTATLYGDLWENGPSVPGQIVVDPATHHLLVAEAYAQAQDVDRQYLSGLQVREFTPAGARVGTVDLDARGAGLPTADTLRYPAPDGRRSTLNTSGGLLARPGGAPPWLLGFGDTDATALRTRVARMAISPSSPDRKLVMLGQLTSLLPDGGFDTVVGQIVAADRGGDRWAATRVIRAGGDLSFTPVDAGAGTGVEDLVVTTANTYLVPSTTSEGLVELTPSGDFLGRIGRPAGTEDCGFANSRLRMAVDPSDGTVVLLQQPAGTEAPTLIRLDRRATGCPRAGGREFTDPTAKLRVAEVRVIVDGDTRRTEYGPFRDLGTDEDELVIDRDSDLSGYIFSVDPADEDNGDADFGTAASCDINVVSAQTYRLTGNGCRPPIDGGPTGNLEQNFQVLRNNFPETGVLEVSAKITDDEGATWGPRTITVRLVGAEPDPLEAKIGAEPTSAEYGAVISLAGSRGFREWRLLLEGRADGPSLPASGFGREADFPRTSVLHTYPGPGSYKPKLILRDADGNETSAEATLLFKEPDTGGPRGVVVPSTALAACTTPLGVPLGVLGLGDDRLCVPADVCDLNPSELGLSQLGLERPASCSGGDADIQEASGEPAAPPRSARPTLVRRALRMATDRRIRATIRCGTGPGVCAGRVRIQIPASAGASSVSVGSTAFSRLRPGARKTVQVRASAAAARLLRRSANRRVRVTITPTAQPGLSRPRADTATVLLTTSSSRTR